MIYNFTRGKDFAPKSSFNVSHLSGLKVLELASVLAGPGVGQFFAELGADVIKVENLKTNGDVTRSWKSAGEQTDDRSAYFCSVNWGKRSIAIDLTVPEGQSIVQNLASKVDIVIASYKPGDASKLNVDYKTLSAENSRLIYGQVTGYGSDNPRVGYDAIIQAEAGFMFMNGEPGGPSLKIPVALMDVLAGHHLKEGLLLALLQRATTGKGSFVEVSLLQAAVASLANQASNWLVANKLPKKQGSAHPNIAPYGDVFETSDRKEVILAIGSDQQFHALCRLLGLNDLTTDPRFIKNASRVENRGALNDVLKNRMAHVDAQVFLDQANEAKIPAGIINDMKQVFEMPEARDLLIKSPEIKGVKTYVGQPQLESDSHLLPPPHFGENTADVLINFLNLSAEEVKKLVLGGVVI